MKTVSIVSLKGGVGKSSSTIMIANYLAASGKSVLVIDTDYSNSTTLYYLRNRVDMRGRSFAQAIRQKNLSANIVPTTRENIDIVPSNEDIESLSIRDSEILKGLISSEEELDVYDVILFDTSQGYHSVVSAVIRASDTILTPIMLSQFDMMSGLTLRAKIMDDCKKYDAWKMYFNATSHYVENANSSQYQYITLYRKTFPNCLDICIPRSTMVTNAIDRSLSIQKSKHEKLLSSIHQLASVAVDTVLPELEAI